MDFGMNTRRMTLTIAIAALTFAGGAVASEIYKWTDEDGNVHLLLFEDSPTAP